MKTLLSIILLAVYLLPAFAMPANAAARRSPVKFPATLLSLYRQSDTILIGRYDRKDDAEITRIEENYSVVNTKIHFDISSALKGETIKFLTINDEEFRYRLTSGENGEPGKEVAFVEDAGSPDPLAQPSIGDTVLLFLKRGDDGKSLEPADYRDGIKKVSATELSVYVDRIKELDSIFSTRSVKPAAVAGWLVRCVEDPATRWDGAYELLQAFRRLDWQQQTERPKKSETSGTGDDNVNQDPLFDTAKYAEALTGQQKAALTNIVIGFDHRSSATSNTAKDLNRGDRELIALVKRWGGAAMSASLLQCLRSRAFSAPENSNLMRSVAEILDDPATKSLARRYAELSYENREPFASDLADVKEQASDEMRERILGSFITHAQHLLTEIESNVAGY